jgi:hypothetical protein
MYKSKKTSLLGSVLNRVREPRGLSLPQGGYRVSVQMMHKPLLDPDYFGDLRSPARNRGRGGFLK